MSLTSKGDRMRQFQQAEHGSWQRVTVTSMGFALATLILLCHGRMALSKEEWGIRFGLSKPSFKELKHYQDFYGKPNFLLGVAGDWKFLNGEFFSLGVGGQFSYYNAKGQQKVKPAGDATSADSFQDAAGKLHLTLIPYQIFMTAQWRPVGEGSWVSVDMWAGYEELYFQEVRSQDGEASSSDKKAARILAPWEHGQLLAKAEEEASKSIVNTGWHNSLVVGVAANFLLNSLDEKSLRSLNKSFGIKAAYVSPFYEMVMDLGSRVFLAMKPSSKVVFSRQAIGLAFTFTTIP